MSSRVSIAATLAAAALAGWSGVAGGAPPAVSSANGSVQMLECSHGKRAADRSALFRGEMRQLPEGRSMRMRFGLSERVGKGAWRGVRAPGLGIWRHARPGVGKFAYRQRIAALQKGTAYRVGVKFQWHDGAGRPIERQVVRSPVCRQGGALADLRIGTVEQFPGPTPDTRGYVVSVVNAGGAAAPRVVVSLLVDGAEVDTRRMGRIGAHRSRQVGFAGPACTSGIEVRVDPSDKVRETSERDNVRSFPCSGTG